jgi:hypothetical protein
MAEYPSTVITAILLSDGWHSVAPGSLGLEYDTSFRDPDSGVAATPVGGPWLRITEPGAGGATIWLPFDSVLGLRHNPVAYPKIGGARAYGRGTGDRA